MKRIIIILLVLVASISVYQIFVSEKSEFVAGESRKYTLYERYFEDDVVLDVTTSYDNDKYNSQKIANNIQGLFQEANSIRDKLISYRNKIRSAKNLQDLEKFRADLKLKQEKLENIKDKLSFQNDNLNDLEDYIIKVENEVESMYLYRLEFQIQKQNIDALNSNIKNFETASNNLIVSTEYREIQIEKELERREKEEMNKVSSMFNYQPKEPSHYNSKYQTNNSYNTPRSDVKFYTNSFGERVQSPTYYSSPPAGATALCRDGTYSFSKNRRGTCSGHGGVQKWLN